MADYHFHVERIKRSAGRSVVAAAAYRTGETLRDDYYGTTHSFKKPDVVKSGIFLPSHAPPRLRDRETLWNDVEKVERHPAAQLAYSFDFSLQNEFTMEENIELAERFIREQFVSRGMICDYAIHDPHRDDDIPNPHVHVLCPIRPLNEDGTWGNKRRRAYALDEDGNRVRDENGDYVFSTEYITDWDDPATLEEWRKAWADLCNAKFEEKKLDCRIDHRSFVRQGIDQIPTVHEGPVVREMEKRGVHTNKGDFNRWVRRTNQRIHTLFAKFKEIVEWIAEIRGSAKEPTLFDFINDYYQDRNLSAYSRKARGRNLQDFTKAANYLASHGLRTMDDLDARVDELNQQTQEYKTRTDARSVRMKQLRDNINLARLYAENKPVYEKLNTIKFKKRREAFKQENSQALDTFYMAKRKLSSHFTEDGKLPVAAWKKELARLETEIAADPGREEYQAIKQELDMLSTVKRCADIAMRDRELTPKQRLQKQAKTMQRRQENTR